MNESRGNHQDEPSAHTHRPSAEGSLNLHGSSLARVFPILLLGVGAILVWLGVDIDRLRSWLESIGPWAPLAFILIGTVLMSLMLPKTVVSLMAGALFGFASGSALMVIIAVAAAFSNYAIGRWWLHDWILEKLRRKELAADDETQTWMHAVRALAVEAGFGLHLLIRLSPVPTMIISYSMGAVGARVQPYLAASAVAIIPQSLWVYSGSTAAMISGSGSSPWRWISVLLSIFVAIWISIVVPREAMKRLREQDSTDLTTSHPPGEA